MGTRKKPVRLSTKATTALKNIYNSSYKSRSIKLAKIKEYSFAILLYWGVIEALLKVLKYKDKIDKPYPDKLNFIRKDWHILKTPYQHNQKKYKLILGDGGKTADCLWGIRDRITHANHQINEDVYEKFKDAAVLFIGSLCTNLPENYEKAHRQYLQKKKKKIRKNKEK